MQPWAQRLLTKDAKSSTKFTSLKNSSRGSLCGERAGLLFLQALLPSLTTAKTHRSNKFWSNSSSCLVYNVSLTSHQCYFNLTRWDIIMSLCFKLPRLTKTVNCPGVEQTKIYRLKTIPNFSKVGTTRNQLLSWRWRCLWRLQLLRSHWDWFSTCSVAVLWKLDMFLKYVKSSLCPLTLLACIVKARFT